MKTLYITYIDMKKEHNSGSSVRPYQMLKALEALSDDVYLLSGSCGNDKRRERCASIRNTEKWLEGNKPDFCYIESSTYPIMLREDRRLIRMLHTLGVPIGYFYRDFYRKFPKLFPRRRGIINQAKEMYLDYLQYKTDKLLNMVDIIYLPSEQSKALFNYKDMRALPPAGENKLPLVNKLNDTVIYVGGISEHYGFKMLIDAFKKLNNGDKVYRLILVCRAAEWQIYGCQYDSLPWLQVEHASGDQLGKLYTAAAAAAVIPKGDNEYNNLAVSVKLFEYMSYGLPVVSSNSEAMNAIIDKCGVGLHVPYDVEKFADGIKQILTDQDAYNRYCANIRKSLLKENLWLHRAQQVASDLCRSEDCE